MPLPSEYCAAICRMNIVPSFFAMKSRKIKEIWGIWNECGEVRVSNEPRKRKTELIVTMGLFALVHCFSRIFDEEEHLDACFDFFWRLIIN